MLCRRPLHAPPRDRLVACSSWSESAEAHDSRGANRVMTILLYILAAFCTVAFAAYARSARHRRRLLKLIEASLDDRSDARSMAFASYRKEVHAAVVYLFLAPVAVLLGRFDGSVHSAALGVMLVPAAISIWWSRHAVQEVRVARNRYDLENRYHHALTQEDLAPRAWAARLAPEQLPDLSGFEIGRVYEAGSGLMSGDFFDVCRLSRTRVAAVIGDVSGHNIESSLTAFQAKYLLRVFLRQFRDPAQAFEEINEQLASGDRNEEFISACVVVFDTEAGTLRYASAGHPAVFLFQHDGVAFLRSTGPLLMLDPKASYFSREMKMESGDLVVMYTDGLSEARTNGSSLFGENRIIRSIERSLDAAPDVLCKSLLDAAKDFAGGVIDDDAAIMAVRRD